MFKNLSLLTTLLRASLLVLAAVGAHAAEVAGVKLPDTVKVGSADLALNGAGLRTRFMMKIYVGALYLPEKKSSAAEALAAGGPKRVAMHMMRNLSAEQLAGALDEGLSNNLAPAEREKMQPQIDALHATMAAVGAAHEKSVLVLDYLPESGATRLSLDGVQKGSLIPGEDFYRALMKIWLCDKPVDASLKAAMLGQG